MPYYSPVLVMSYNARPISTFTEDAIVTMIYSLSQIAEERIVSVVPEFNYLYLVYTSIAQ